MWKFLSKLGSAFRSSSPPPAKVEADREFTFHEEPWQIPDELKDLRVERLDSDKSTLLLRGFDVDLTSAQTTYSDDPKTIAWSCRALRWAAKYHGLDAEATAPVRLHRENLILIGPRHYDSNRDRQPEIIAKWLSCFGWSSDRQFNLQQVSTNRPVEDGFFRCIRVLTGDSGVEETGSERLDWQELAVTSSTLIGVLCEFMEEECDRIVHPEYFIRECYKGIPREELTHPAFALMEFPCFDGMAVLEFGGSIWSPNELRLWSRAGYLHK